MQKNTLAATKQALEALDFTEENERYAAIQAQLADFKDAQEKISQRIGAINAEIREGRDKLKNDETEKAADALLAGGDVLEITRHANTNQALLDERDALQATARKIRHREEDLKPELRPLELACHERAAEAAQPLADAILLDAIAAGERLVEAYSALYAISQATRSHCTGKDELADVVDALKGLFEATDSYPAVPIPADVQDALSPLNNKGRVARMAVPSVAHNGPNVRAWSEIGSKIRRVRLMAMQAAQAAMERSPN